MELLGDWTFIPLRVPNEAAGKTLLSQIDIFAGRNPSAAVACINGNTICSRLQLCAAAQRIRAKNYTLRSKGKHAAELLLTLSPTRNITESLKHFGCTGVEECVIVGVSSGDGECARANKLAEELSIALLSAASLITVDDVCSSSNKAHIAALYNVSPAEQASPQGLEGVVVNRIATADVK